MDTVESYRRRRLNDVGLEEAKRRFRRELPVYCYRILGWFDNAEDHAQVVCLTGLAIKRHLRGPWLHLRRYRPRAVPDPPAGSTSPLVAHLVCADGITAGVWEE